MHETHAYEPARVCVCARVFFRDACANKFPDVYVRSLSGVKIKRSRVNVKLVLKVWRECERVLGKKKKSKERKRKEKNAKIDPDNQQRLNRRS